MTSRPVLALALVALVSFAACGDGGESTDTPTNPPTGAATDVPIPTEATADPTPEPTVEPGATEAPASDEPTEEPTDEPSPEASGAAAACTGNEQNQDFFASVAAAVDWPVLCLAEDGWFVTTGSYSLRDGGRLQIGYRGPGDATLEFREGYICEGEGCAPPGVAIGDVTLGDLENAQLIQSDDGEFAIVADPDANPSWILVSNGLSGDQLTELAAGFATVGD